MIWLYEPWIKSTIDEERLAEGRRKPLPGQVIKKMLVGKGKESFKQSIQKQEKRGWKFCRGQQEQ